MSLTSKYGIFLYTPYKAWRMLESSFFHSFVAGFPFPFISYALSLFIHSVNRFVSKKELLTTFKVRLSPSKKIVFICFNKNPLKKMKNAFCFMLKAHFVIEIFKFLSWHFGYVEKWLDKKAKIYDITDWTANNYNTYIVQYLKK